MSISQIYRDNWVQLEFHVFLQEGIVLMQVVDFAGAIPKYSPVGLFTAQNSYSGQAGVYLGYINSTLFVSIAP